MFLGELNYPVADLKGIGPAAAGDLGALGIRSVAQLIRHYPVRYEDRSTTVLLAHSSAEHPAVTTATVTGHDSMKWKGGRALKVFVEDESATAALLCFGRNFLMKKLPVGKKIRLSGPFERNSFGEIQTSAFVFEDCSTEPVDFGKILPVYPLGGSLKQKQLRNAVRTALEGYLRSLQDELPEPLRSELGFPKKLTCLYHIHFPPDMEAAEAARQALIYEELFLLQLTIARRSFSASSHPARPWSEDKISALGDSLPFELTPGQKTALDDIRKDLASSRPMMRLLQGEVGSGKTLVAFMAALGVIGAGRQAAFMAPTELLGRQHADNAARLLEPLGVRVAFLTGDVPAAARSSLTAALADGEVDLAVGTHALFSQDVDFRDLGLIIIDEQHRFGVQQRRSLLSKGNSADCLALSATPIPRTLTMTAFGDMDVSSIKTMPPGRQPVETHLARIGNEQRVYDFVRGQLREGCQAYFVYPLIGESEKSHLKDAQNMHARLSGAVFPEYKCALIHSKVPQEEQRHIMNEFREGQIQILVATSVVEVGVDVPQATCMVIEHAERFGLSALHQLRGRVGRGSQQSYCFLVYAEPLTDEGKHRLLVMKDTHDGFILAEEDLKMRGPGDMAGTRQSGFMKFSIADPVRDLHVLTDARERVQKMMRSGDLPDFLEDLFKRCPPFNEELIRSG